MFKSAQTKVNVATAMKNHRVDRCNVSPSDEKFRVPKDELPRGIIQMDGKLKNCK
jgi:hypothetical protein